MKFFRRRPVKYRCFHCDRRVREGERHDYVRCVSGTSWLTLLVDWLDDRSGRVLAVIASFLSMLAARAGFIEAGVGTLVLVLLCFGHHIDRLERRRG